MQVGACPLVFSSQEDRILLRPARIAFWGARLGLTQGLRRFGPRFASVSATMAVYRESFKSLGRSVRHLRNAWQKIGFSYRENHLSLVFHHYLSVMDAR